MKLEIKNLSVEFDSVEVVSGADLLVEEGTFLTILGNSGSGKSTILNAIAGLVSIKSGKFVLNEIDITDVPTEKREIGYVFQKPLLFPHLNVLQNVIFGLEVSKWNKADIVIRKDELLELLDIKELEKRMPYELSGGQQQRVAIARTLASYPKIVLMDEPFSGLDPILREKMGWFLKEIQCKLKLTIVFVTHDANEALRLSDSIIFLDNGKILQTGKPNELYFKPKHKAVGNFFGDSNWIEGIISNNTFKSDIGSIALKDETDCHALVHIRPHKIKINDDSGKFTITSFLSVGKECKITTSYNNQVIIIETQDNKEYMVGDTVDLIFPSEDVYIVERW